MKVQIVARSKYSEPRLLKTQVCKPVQGNGHCSEDHTKHTRT